MNKGALIKQRLLMPTLLGLSVTFAVGQESLGDAARLAREEKARHAHAKIVVDDEVAPLKSRSPFPEISLKGLDNNTEICLSMDEFRKAHTKQEFESAVRDWFSDYDEMIRLYLKQQLLAQERLNSRYYPEPVYDDNERQSWQTMLRRQRMDELERRRLNMEQGMINRVQLGLSKVQAYLVSRNYDFKWFKVRRSVSDDI